MYVILYLYYWYCLKSALSVFKENNFVEVEYLLSGICVVGNLWIIPV